MTQEEKAEAFRALHEGEPFFIPNPWDSGSARVLAALGFEALATTSSGFAFTLGRRDGSATLDDVAKHVESLSQATDLPLSIDLENGYGADPDSCAEAVARVAEAGAVGGSIEDYDPERRIYDFDHAVERVTAAVEAAGADVLYAPGLRTVDEVRTVCSAVSKPVNVLARADLSAAEIFEAGAQRISVGGRLTWVGANAMVSSARAMLERGDLSGLDAGLPPGF